MLKLALHNLYWLRPTSLTVSTTDYFHSSCKYPKCNSNQFCSQLLIPYHTGTNVQMTQHIHMQILQNPKKHIFIFFWQCLEQQE